MIVRANDKLTEVQVTAVSKRDVMDLASILHHMGQGLYDLHFEFPCPANTDNVRLRFVKVVHIKGKDHETSD